MKYVWFVYVEESSEGEYELFSSKSKAFEKFNKEIEELKTRVVNGNKRFEFIAEEKEYGKVMIETTNHTSVGWLTSGCVEWGKKIVK